MGDHSVSIAPRRRCLSGDSLSVVLPDMVFILGLCRGNLPLSAGVDYSFDDAVRPAWLTSIRYRQSGEGPRFPVSPLSILSCHRVKRKMSYE